MSKKTKYIWEKEIALIDGNNVAFTDGTSAEYKSDELLILISDEPRDESQVQQKIVLSVTPEIMKVLSRYNLDKDMVGKIAQAVISTYNYNFNKAVGKAFWTYEDWKHPDSFPWKIRISDIERLLDSEF